MRAYPNPVRKAQVPRLDSRLSGAFRSLSRAASVFCAALGLFDLAGWALDIPLLRGDVSNVSPMIPHTGFLFFLVGLSLWLKNQPSRRLQRLSLGLSLYVGLAGLLFVSEYLFGWNYGIDQLWFPQEIVAYTPLYPGRPSPQSALNFVLAGLALSLMDVEIARRWHLTETIALLLASIPFLAILGYAYQLPLLYHISILKPIALNSAFNFYFLALGILFARPDRGWMAVFASDTAGGYLLRRLLPATLLVPPLLAGSNFLLEQAGHYDPKTGDAFLVLTLMSLAVTLICGNAASLNRVADEREQAEQKLSDLNHQLNLILDSAGEGIYGVDRDGRCTFINSAAIHMLGFGKEELIGQCSHALFHHSRLDGSPFPRDECPAHRVLSGTPLQIANDAFWRKDGTSFPVEYVSTPLLDEGRAIGVVVVFRDVSERRAMEEALRKSHAMLSMAQRIARIGSWEWEPESDRLSLSDEVNRILEMEHEGGVPTLERYLERAYPAERAGIRARLQEAFMRREPVVFQQRVLCPDGSERDVEIRAEFSENATSKHARLVGTLQDITELKKAEAEIAQRTAELNQTRELSRMKDIFISTISHEMKTPLSLIIGYTELLEERYPNDEFLAQLAEGSHRLSSHISKIIDYSVMLSGRIPLYKTEVNFPELIQNAVEASKESLAAKGLHLEIELDPGTPPIQADSRRICQALAELLENAERFTPENGKLGIRTAVVDGYVRLDVWDTGPGIPEEELPWLWSAFSQLSVDEALRKGGLGLGLTIAKKITELHGGKVQVESQVGRGSCFSLLFPVDASG